MMQIFILMPRVGGRGWEQTQQIRGYGVRNRRRLGFAHVVDFRISEMKNRGKYKYICNMK